MRSDDKIQRTFVFLMIFQIMGLAFVVILLSNNAFAQTLHDRTLYETVKQTPELKISQIDLDGFPTAIAVDEKTNTVYVANEAVGGLTEYVANKENSVSVINGSDNTKIGEDIPVGDGLKDIYQLT